jgi:hypothetical protein
MVTIEFLAQFLVHDGASYNAGERATVPQAVADRALQLGCARLVEDAKQLAESPGHKQVRRAPAMK